MSTRAAESGCVLVPAYQEQGRIGPVVAGIRRFFDSVVVVDDGSTDATAREAEAAGAVVVRHPVNRGKGVALKTGLRYAAEKGYAYVITMDADGQHDPGDIPAFLDAYRQTQCPVIIGSRMHALSAMPRVRRWTNIYMSWLLSRAIGQTVPDTQCGFRLYRLDVFAAAGGESERFAAESETLLRLGERGVKMGSVPIKVIYRDERSKINPVTDTIRFFRMLRRHRLGSKRTKAAKRGF
jgi:glycosyltransferase involved in cell wall biosynthesis